jgi:hypothetical protein
MFVFSFLCILYFFFVIWLPLKGVAQAQGLVGLTPQPALVLLQRHSRARLWCVMETILL